MTDILGWEEYYQRVKGRAPRELLLNALTYFPDESVPDRTAISQLLTKIFKDGQARLQTRVVKFEDITLPRPISFMPA